MRPNNSQVNSSEIPVSKYNDDYFALTLKFRRVMVLLRMRELSANTLVHTIFFRFQRKLEMKSNQAFQLLKIIIILIRVN